MRGEGKERNSPDSEYQYLAMKFLLFPVKLPSLTVEKVKMATNPVNMGSVAIFFLYTYTIKPPAMLVVPLTALALDKKTSNDIISVGPKPHYI